MDEKKVTKISLSTFCLILAIIAIAVMGLFIYKLNTEKSEEKQKSIELQKQVSDLSETINQLQGKINSISNTINSNEIKTSNDGDNNNSNKSENTIDYIELNESNYNKYPLSKIINISKNNDSTYTIISRVYEAIELPILSKSEVEKLENGGTVKIYNWTLKLSDSEENVITSIDENNWMKFYIHKNSNGTASVSDYSEASLVKPTQIYMKAIVDKSVLDNNVLEYDSNERNSNEITLFTYNTESIQFTNGKLSSISWTGV